MNGEEKESPVSTAVGVDDSVGRKARPSIVRDHHPAATRKLLIAHSIEEDGNLKECEVHHALRPQVQRKDSNDPYNKSDGSFWIDADLLESADALKLKEEIIDKFSLSPWFARHVSQRQQMQTPQVLALARTVLIVVRILDPDAAEGWNVPRYAAALCLEGLLLTVMTMPESRSSADEEMASSQRVANRKMFRQSTLDSMYDRELPESSCSAALSVWLTYHVGQVASEVNLLRRKTFVLAEKMDDDPGSVALSEILDLKDRLLKVLSVAEEQSECVQSLVEAEINTKALDFSNIKGILGVLLSTTGSTERMALRMEKRIADFRQTYDANQQDRINGRLAVLTILSAIFLPLTLMAGLWGMNFENMPELDNENGYFFALAAMAGVALTLLFMFYHFGWLQ